MKMTIRTRFNSVVKPAFWFWLAMSQYGPTLAQWGEGRLIDLTIRHVVAFVAVCIGISSLRSNVPHHPHPQGTEADKRLKS